MPPEVRFAASASAMAFTAFALAVIFTPIVRATARRFGAVAAPRADRWHARPTAMMGGIAIYIAVMAATLALQRQNRDSWVVLIASSVMFVFGLADDHFEFKPYQKLVAQVIAALAVSYFGLVLPWTSSAALNIGLTLLWLVGITNAVNLLDNMDGLAAGISAVAAIFLGINFFLNHQPAEAVTVAAFAAALIGFLVYNHNPASIFMGDCGSMFIGFFLASMALLSGTAGGRSRSIVPVLAVPVLVLFVPIFDTTFVAVMRKLAGRSMMKGGRDHTSHRLVALGLTERRAVWLLWALAIVSGALGMSARHMAIDVSVALIGSFVIILTFLGIHLARVRVYDEQEVAAAREKPLVSFLVELSYKRRIFEVALDVLLISLSYYLAYALKFGAFSSISGDWSLFLQTLPIVVCVKLATFLASGIYRGVWRYMSLSNVFDCVRAVVLGSVAAVVTIVIAFRFSGFSRTVFVVDGLILLLMVTGSRFAFRILRRLFPIAHAEAHRALIYGAGDGGELVVREMRNNTALQAVPAGFVDDDPSKAGRLIHGLRVYAASARISELCRQLNATEVVISTEKIAHERLALIVGECAAAGIAVTKASIRFQRLAPSDFGWVLPTHDEVADVAPIIAGVRDPGLLHAKTRPTASN